MPPGSQHGPGKKLGPGAIQRQRSRNTTPAAATPAPTANLPPVEAIDTEYLEMRVEHMRNINFDDIVDQSASTALVPDCKSLDGMMARLQKLQEIIERRSNFCDRGMRLLATARKNRSDDADAGAGAGATTADDRRDVSKADKRNKKKRKATDSVAAQEIKVEQASPLRDSSKTNKNARTQSPHSTRSRSASPDKMDIDSKSGKGKKKKEEEEDDDDEESSSEDEDPRPARPVPQAMTFGEDPSTFNDPTVYEVRPVTKDTSMEMKKEIYSVAVFPENDLADLIAGEPPEKDYSIAKPQNQISFSTFSTYTEPYFRHFTEEDLGFLRERGDRVTPFHMPKKGKKHYTEIWAEEDGMEIDRPSHTLPPNQPRGSIEHMDDDLAETDKLSVGPLLTRLLQVMRPEGRGNGPEDKGITATNGDTPMNGDSFSEANGETEDGMMNGNSNGVVASAPAPAPAPGPGLGQFPPATQMPESNSEAWKKSIHPKLDYAQVDERLRQELKHIGLLPQEGNFDNEYDGHYDDEVTGRLRFLQERLRLQMFINGARKARLMELVKERMAFQEYQTILEDLDTQVQNAYLKRTRTIGKSKKNKRPGGAGGASHAAGGAGGAGMARPGIGDVAKTVMERRRRWMDTIGSVFEDDNLVKVPRNDEPDSSIFKEVDLAELMEREKEMWDEEVEDEG
ncbi:hypothetical protein BROUX41_005274 [Berkeleyomyces rouxiae]